MWFGVIWYGAAELDRHGRRGREGIGRIGQAWKALTEGDWRGSGVAGATGRVWQKWIQMGRAVRFGSGAERLVSVRRGLVWSGYRRMGEAG